jgi:hypothetical protein
MNNASMVYTPCSTQHVRSAGVFLVSLLPKPHYTCLIPFLGLVILQFLEVLPRLAKVCIQTLPGLHCMVFVPERIECG